MYIIILLETGQSIHVVNVPSTVFKASCVRACVRDVIVSHTDNLLIFIKMVNVIIITQTNQEQSVDSGLHLAIGLGCIDKS